ncbi:MAG: hypothetical protein WAV02_21135, partial [Stellaceae bacterium]
MHDLFAEQIAAAVGGLDLVADRVRERHFDNLARVCRALQPRMGEMAEREGFEPSVPRKRDNGFRDRPDRPLR